MKNDSRKARREADRVAQAAREAAGLAPGAALPAERDQVPAPVAAAPPAPESADAATPQSATAPAATVQPAKDADAGTDPKTEAASPAPAPERVHRAKTRGRALGLVGSLGVLCLGAAAIAAGSVFPPATAATGTPVALTSLPAGDALASCPATMKLFTGAGSGVDPEFAPASKDARTGVRAAVLSDSAGRIPGTEMLRNDAGVEATIAPRLSAAEAAKATGAGADGTSERKGAPGAVSNYAESLTVHAQPLGGVQSLVSAVRSYSAADGDLAGLAAAGCTAPSAESWLTGAVTTPGSTAVLNLVNPSASVAQVRVDLRGADGMVSAPSLGALAVAPGESKSIILAGYAPNEKALSAKVTSSGGRINATIQQSTLRGLVPGGVDYLGGSATANNTQVIPGVAILDPKLSGELAKPAANSDAAAELVLAATSAEGATVKVRALGRNGEVPIPGGGEVVVASNATARMPLGGLPAGQYTIVVEGDSAVSASVKMVRGTKANEPIDLAWAGAANRLGSENLMVLPPVGRSTLVLNAPEDTATVSVRALGADGKLSATRNIELSGGKTVALAASDFGAGTTALVLSATGAPGYASAVVQDGAFGIAAVPVSDAALGSKGVQVLLRD
ncbi:DUF5719 family protein [Paeniglutamicibacter sulfureus]|uniref:Large extracellular alpha-helical protein n=1 Tax=Paeniglutamicibacter sulfureus TaxID=43666 RepID=A0ABU2BG09_9MICC|nr:DUF5719 family protein [Paeniglutamicibacter sulfureus]MDR7357525.1 hypothetical protein [Paeniglutamicibacter sulfureus]